MATEDKPTEEAGKGDKNSLPVESAPTQPTIKPVAQIEPPAPKGEPPAPPAQPQPTGEPTPIPEPLLIRILDEPSRFERSTIRLGWAGLFLGFLSFLAAVTAGLFIYHQWWEMNAQTGFMNRAAVQARKDSADSSVAAARQLAVMQGQLTQQRNAMILDQRAWIGITNVNVTAEIGKPLTVNIGFNNSGKSPAKRVDGVAVIDPVSRGQSPDFTYTREKHVRIGVFPPNAPDHFPLIGTHSMSTGETRPLTEELHKELSDGDVTLYAHGIVRYSDIFGVNHWVRFCYFADFQTGGVSLCKDAKHNDADQNPN